MEQLKKDILNCLQDLKGSGKFASIHTVDFLFPGLEIEGIGEISYPINASQAKDLIQVARKAPFGKGSQTILDNEVRSAWEIDAEELHFNNPSWNDFLNKAIKNIKADLGLEGYTIAAHLYKLLIYEKGDFFLPHKDSEKEKGMFGTLIIGLPAHYTGGELVICFEGKEEIADFANTDPSHSLNYAAFYADCDHEVRPLTSGHRICLVYNLIQEKAGQKIELQSVQTHANKLANLFVQNSKLDLPYIILLGHQYTPENFSEQALKLNDRAKAETLLLAAKQAGYYAKFCLVTSFLGGSPEYDGYYHDDDDDLEMGEVYDEWLAIGHWLEDRLPAFNQVQVNEADLIASFQLNEGEPLIKESSGYMGNYGPDIMHWYHYGAIVVWSPEVNAQLLLTQNTATQLHWIAYFNSIQKTSDAEALAVREVLTNGLNDQLQRDGQGNFEAVADWLISRDEKTFLTNLSNERLQFLFKKINTDCWLRLFQFMPAEQTKELFGKIGEHVMLPTLEKLLEVLNAMVDIDELEPIVMRQKALLPNQLRDLYAKKTKGINATALSALLQLAQLPTEKEWTKTIFATIAENPDWEYIHHVLAPQLLTPTEPSELSEQLLSFCREYLQQRVNNKPQPPLDWSRPLPDVPAYHKKHWQILKDFLESPTEAVFDFRKNQSERSEIETAIKNVVVDLKYETIRKGSPHTLRITKTQDAYQRLMKNWHADVALLEKLK